MAPSFLENFYTHTILILNILQKSYLKSLLVLSETIFFLSATTVGFSVLQGWYMDKKKQAFLFVFYFLSTADKASKKTWKYLFKTVTGIKTISHKLV